MNYQATIYLIRKHQLGAAGQSTLVWHGEPTAISKQAALTQRHDISRELCFPNQILLLGHETTKNELMKFFDIPACSGFFCYPLFAFSFTFGTLWTTLLLSSFLL
jgi:hypothetical protein